MRRLLYLLLPAVWLCLSGQAWANVIVTFYSYDLGENYPHAFFTAQGHLSDGTVIDNQYGFTTKIITPTILFGSVKGYVRGTSKKYIQKSDPHFAIALTDEDYQSVMDIVQDWSSRPGKSYNLNKRNCVHFVRDVLVALGIKVNEESSNFKKPKSYLREVSTLNPYLEWPISGKSKESISVATPAMPTASAIERP